MVVSPKNEKVEVWISTRMYDRGEMRFGSFPKNEKVEVPYILTWDSHF